MSLEFEYLLRYITSSFELVHISLIFMFNGTFTGYESQFDKKAFGEELELEELESFFHECDLYPSNMEIDDGIDVIFQGRV